ncbi:MAG: hypothetical protein GC161_16255 [Planctomycetaceae bacterium]|nr:hypothetical protein [Planctomycetaceae bacterium]
MVALPKPRVGVADADAFYDRFQKLSAARWNFVANRVPLYRHVDGAWKEPTRETLPGIVREHLTPVDEQGNETELPSALLDLLARILTTPLRCIQITNQIPTPDSFFEPLRAMREFLDGMTWRPSEGRITCGPGGRELSHKDFIDELCLCAVWHDGAGNIAPGADLVLGTFLAAAIFGGEVEVIGVARRAGMEVIL